MASSSKVSPTTYTIMQFFTYAHLNTDLKLISGPVCELAYTMAKELPDCEETYEGLRKLLEAKDCFVRAKLVKV